MGGLQSGRPRLVELVGPPGAGKSTIAALLRAADPELAAPPILRRSRLAGLLLWDLGGVIWLLVRRRTMDRRWSRDTLAMMAYLRTWRRVLAREANDAPVVLFDQGPIYSLTRAPMRDGRLSDWWRDSLAAWREMLDVVIWLEAPDHVLLQRIDARDKDHRLKGSQTEAGLQALIADRATYERALCALEEVDPHPRVLRFDTSIASAETVAEQVRAAMTDLP